MAKEYPVFIMHNVPREKLSQIMKAVKGILGNDIIFSITTDTNLAWKVNDLIEELISEHEHIKNMKNHHDN